MNSALTSNDLTALRTEIYSSQPYLSFAPQTSYATALVNQSSFDIPLSQLTVDNTSAAWLTVTKGMTVWIGTTVGTHNIGIYRVRKAPGATTLYLMEMSDGDPGRVAVSTLRPLVDNAHITVIMDHNAWSVFPRIDLSSGAGVFYKDQDLAYTNQNSTVIACPLNLGANKPGWVNGSNVLAHTFTATISAFDSATISSIEWFDNEVSVSTSNPLVRNYSTGHHLVRCVATLSNGAVITAVRHVWAHHPTNYPPMEINITSDTRNRRGRRFSIELISTFDNALREGALCCIWEDVTWGTNTISSASTSAIGFADRISGDTTRSPESADVTTQLDIISPLLYLEKLTAFSQQLAFAASPANWQEAIANLMHLDYFVFYLLYYHTTILSLCDFNKCGLSSYKANTWRVDPGNAVAQINRTASRLNVEITNTSDGALWLRQDPALTSSANRPNVVERYPLTSDDMERISVQKRILPEYAYVEAYSFSSGTSSPTAYRSQAAGRVGGQGSQSIQMENQLVANQNESNERSVNKLAQVNNPYESIEFTLNSGADVIEPALWYFLPLTLAASLWPENEAVSNLRLIPESVSRSYAGDSTVTTNVSAVPETTGYNITGQTMPIRIGNDMDDSVYPMPTFDDFGFPILNFDPLGYPTLYGLPQLPVSPSISTSGGTPGTIGIPDPFILAWTADAGYIANPAAGTPNWVQIFTQSGQGVRWMTWDQLSPFVLGSGDSLRVWAVTGYKLWRTNDIIGQPLTLKQDTTGYYYILRNARGYPGGKGLVAYGRATGSNGSDLYTGNNYILWSPDGGDNITELDLGAGSSGGEHGVDCDDFNLGIIIAPNNKILKFCTTYGGAFSNTITGISMDGTQPDSCALIRIPYLKIQSGGALNNNPNALHFIYGQSGVIGTGFLRKCILNASTGVASETDITPDISGIKYKCDGYQTVEIFGGDGQRMLMCGAPDSGGGQNKILGTTDGGTTWTIQNSPAFNLNYVHFVEPEFGGDGLKAWFMGAGGIYYTDDFGVTLTNKTNDFASDVSSTAQYTTGVLAIHGG